MRDTWSKSKGPAQERARVPMIEEEGGGVKVGFFEQLWDCPKVVRRGKEIEGKALVWIEKGLVESRSLSERNCFPF
jgi:hypothetical protein